MKPFAVLPAIGAAIGVYLGEYYPHFGTSGRSDPWQYTRLTFAGPFSGARNVIALRDAFFLAVAGLVVGLVLEMMDKKK